MHVCVCTCQSKSPSDELLSHPIRYPNSGTGVLAQQRGMAAAQRRKAGQRRRGLGHSGRDGRCGRSPTPHHGVDRDGDDLAHGGGLPQRMGPPQHRYVQICTIFAQYVPYAPYIYHMYSIPPQPMPGDVWEALRGWVNPDPPSQHGTDLPRK